MTRTTLFPVLALGLACGGVPEQAADTAAAADPATGIVTMTAAGRAAAGIATAPVREAVHTDVLEALGVVSLDERRTARPGAIVDGVIAEVQVQPGDRVEAGAVLALILSHRIHDVWAEYFQASARRQESEAELDYARTVEARAERLTADRALAEQELHRARADRVAAEEELAAARAEVRRTEQDLLHYGLTPSPDADPRENEHVPVRAPFAGAVIERLVSPGEAVTLGAPLTVVSDLSRVWITAEVPEADLHRLSAPKPVEFRVTAWPDEVFAATLTTIGDVINPATRRVTVRAEADNPGGRLKPEMFATLAIAAGAPRGLLVVPAAAVQELAGEPVVFIETGPGEFRRRRVVTGAAFDGDIEIREGVASGEMVAVEGAFLLKSALIGLPEEE
jgi:cobalt-zinc-cadmium efflux system membrane fusion protein